MHDNRKALFDSKKSILPAMDLENYEIVFLVVMLSMFGFSLWFLLTTPFDNPHVAAHDHDIFEEVASKIDPNHLMYSPGTIAYRRRTRMALAEAMREETEGRNEAPMDTTEDNASTGDEEEIEKSPYVTAEERALGIL
ncbi:hypothetical protein CB0940_05540 [Cercospora beticola]|uniref:Uncharacterized protein n=1 Tax=Cercospora beticola TaxID=122368 RepID=A0A2G5HZC3_CERBT|nr:hypothetical protein CB0940_05540 [Cercospora beticola]PIA97899.1 hypothetical protein CB0940_05540 [Cercospora beticola]WPA98098.1 hypothetical protein RHO25_002709 [Cercospora beticola]CAK1359311.1 unnamed protein product [Cercospora beticola]